MTETYLLAVGCLDCRVVKKAPLFVPTTAFQQWCAAHTEKGHRFRFVRGSMPPGKGLTTKRAQMLADDIYEAMQLIRKEWEEEST